MAFTQETFSPVSSGSTESPSYWSYKTQDFIEDVATPGYFTNKRFQLREGDQIYVASGNSNTILAYKSDTLAPEVIASSGQINGPQVDWIGREPTAQNPTDVDTPLQVKFGPPIVGLFADLDGVGTTTIKQSGNYRLRATFALGRTTTAGDAILGLRLLINTGSGFVQTGSALWDNLDDSDFTLTREFTVTQVFNAGDQIRAEIARDSSGVNNGGLLPITPTGLVSWGASNSATLTIARYF